MKYLIILLLASLIILTGCDVNTLDNIRQSCIEDTRNSTIPCAYQECMYLRADSTWNGYEDRIITYKDCQLEQLRTRRD